MSLYTHGFTFLPRPPRFALQLGDEATRMVIPDFETVEQMRLFIVRLLIIKIDIPGFYIQVMLCASLAAFLTVVVVLIVVRRMYEKSFWLVRVMNRPSGRILVPNALLGFVVAEGVYIVLFISYMWLHRSWFSVHVRPPFGLVCWMNLIWIPLITGPLLAIYGNIFAISALTVSKGDSSALKRFFQRAIVINITAVLVPSVGFVGVAIPSLIANARINAALQMQLDWVARYEGVTDFRQSMLTELQLTYFAVVHGYHISSIAFVVWTAYAIAVGIAYVVVSWRLISAVRRELRRSRDGAHQLDMFATTNVVSLMDESEEGGSNQHVHFRMETIISPNNSISKSGKQSTASSCATEQSSNADFSPTSMVKERRERQYSHFVVLPEHQADSSEAIHSPVSLTRRQRFFAAAWKRCPNIIAKTERVPMPSSSHASRNAQIVNLRKAYRHLLIQLFVVAPGCLTFAVLAFWAAFELAGSTDQPVPGKISDTGGELAQARLILMLCWATVALGSATLLAVAQRTYEPVFNSINRSVSRALSDRGAGSEVERKSGSGFYSSRAAEEAKDPHTTSTFFETTSYSCPSSDSSLAKTSTAPSADNGTQLTAHRRESKGVASVRTAMMPLAMRRHTISRHDVIPEELESERPDE